MHILMIEKHFKAFFKGQFDATLSWILGLKVLWPSMDSSGENLAKIITCFYLLASQLLLIIRQIEMKDIVHLY